MDSTGECVQGVVEGREEEWIVSQARSTQKSDLHAAKSWLIVGRTLFPRNFSIQFEMYNLEKNCKNVRDAAKVFEEMALSFPREPQLWLEIHSMSDALQSDSMDESSVFLRELFGALPSNLQCSMLLSTADASTNTLSQCRLLMLVVDRYPSQVSDQGVKLVELLLQAEKIARCASPVNCYRKYLACDVLPLLLRTGVHVATHRQFFSWLEKVIEFFVCYVTQPSSHDVASGGSSVKVRLSSIEGLTEKESYVSDPWNQLIQLMQMVAGQLQWKISKLFQADSCESQLNALYDSVRNLAPTDAASNMQYHQLFYSSLILFLRSVHCYTMAIQPALGSSVDHPGLILVETCKMDGINNFAVELVHRSKKLKVEPDIPNVIAPEIAPADVVSNFNIGFQCWEFFQGDLLKNDFSRLYQQWSPDCWSLLRHFEIDACICQGLYQEAIVKLQTVAGNAPPGSYMQSQVNLQMACCYYYLGSYVKSCQLIIDIMTGLPPIKDQTYLPSTNATSNHTSKPPGRQLQLVSCTQSDILSYSISIMISCLKDKALKSNLADDILLGHMIVLTQFNWPKYESLFYELMHTVSKHGKFTYSLFCMYVINIDILEEFAYIWTQGVTLDILPTSAKGTAQARTVTRGVNKVVKEDIKLALERQVSRSNENIVNIIRQFLLDEAELMKQNLLT